MDWRCNAARATISSQTPDVSDDDLDGHACNIPPRTMVLLQRGEVTESCPRPRCSDLAPTGISATTVRATSGFACRPREEDRTVLLSASLALPPFCDACGEHAMLVGQSHCCYPCVNRDCELAPDSGLDSGARVFSSLRDRPAGIGGIPRLDVREWRCWMAAWNTCRVSERSIALYPSRGWGHQLAMLCFNLEPCGSTSVVGDWSG